MLRRKTVHYAAELAALGHPTSVRVASCASLIKITGHPATRSINLCRCESRYCPSCALERIRGERARWSARLQVLLASEPDLSWAFATVGAAPVSIVDCLGELRRQRTVLRKLRESKAWPSPGGVNTQEVAFVDCDVAHPHSHLLVALPQGSAETGCRRVEEALAGRFASPHVTLLLEGEPWREADVLSQVLERARYLSKMPSFARGRKGPMHTLAACRAQLAVALGGARMAPQKVGGLWAALSGAAVPDEAVGDAEPEGDQEAAVLDERSPAESATDEPRAAWRVYRWDDHRARYRLCREQAPGCRR